jgi:hypothetical protein
MFVCYECSVLSGRGLCDELITCPEESYWLWCIVVCDLEKLREWGHDPHWVAAPQQKISAYIRVWYRDTSAWIWTRQSLLCMTLLTILQKKQLIYLKGIIKHTTVRW